MRLRAGPLAIVPSAAAPRDTPTGSDPVRHRARLPGLGARFLASLSAEAGRRGWGYAETQGLLAAAEERCALWVVAARPLRRPPRVAAWRHGRLVDSPGGIGELMAAVESAPAGIAVCLAALSGTSSPSPSLVSSLISAGAHVGRVDNVPAAVGRAGWAVEVLVAPALAADGLAGLRERLVSAPRCAWCRLPVLGSSCPRCREGGA